MGNSHNTASSSHTNGGSAANHANANLVHVPSATKCDNMVISSPLTQSLAFTSSSPLVHTRCQHLQQQSSQSNSSNSNISSSNTSTKRKTKSKDSLLNNSFESNLTNINFIDACSLIGKQFKKDYETN